MVKYATKTSCENNKYLSKYLEIAKSIRKNYKKCPNQYVGTIKMVQEYTENLNLKDEYREDINDRKHNKKKIILILESPSDDEYEDDENPKPANGITGEKIKKYIKILVKYCIELLPEQKKGKYKNFEKMELYLVNPVPYPCDFWTKYDTSYQHAINEIKSNIKLLPIKTSSTYSGLQNDIRKITDEIFKIFWDSQKFNFKENFKNELREIYKNGDIIINCCTANLKNSVQKEIEEIANNNAKFISTHPSSWERQAKNRYVHPYNDKENKKYFKNEIA